MLIKVFGIWILSGAAYFLAPIGAHNEDCQLDISVGMNTRVHRIENHTCDEVAAEINKQIQESKDGR